MLQSKRCQRGALIGGAPNYVQLFDADHRGGSPSEGGRFSAQGAVAASGEWTDLQTAGSESAVLNGMYLRNSPCYLYFEQGKMKSGVQPLCRVTSIDSMCVCLSPRSPGR